MKISKHTVNSLKPSSSDQYIWDETIKGFGLKVTPAGKKVFFIQYRIGGRSARTRRFKIGTHGTITVEKARAQARFHLGEVASGIDPAKERDRIRNGTKVSQAMTRFFTEYVEVKRKTRTIDGYRGISRRSILPHLGNRHVEEIQRSDIAHLHYKMASTPYSANRTLALLSKFFNWCEQVDLRTERTNPCFNIEKYREHHRQRFLSPEELARLETVLKDKQSVRESSPWTIAAIRLLIHTGARLSEILTLRWEFVDFEAGILRLPDSKTGAKSIYLSETAIEILNDLPRLEDNPHVICGQRKGEHLVNLQKPWRKLREKAELEGLRLHDLRHSFASFAVASGLSLPMIGALLGHTQPQTTARYAHLADDPLREALSQVSHAIKKASNSKKTPRERVLHSVSSQLKALRIWVMSNTG